MKQIIILLIAALFVSCTKKKIQPAVKSPWIEDIEFIKKELPDKHINLFAKITEQEFNSEIENLIKKVPHFKENDIICGLMKIFANIGDSHTGLHTEKNIIRFKMAPVKFEIFDDGVYITEIIEAGKQYLKQKVVAINNVPIDMIRDSIATIIPHDNSYFVKSAFPAMLRLYELLEAMKITDSRNSYHLNFENGDDVLIRGSNNSATYYSCYQPNNKPLYLTKNDSNYWYKIVDNNIVYLQYNRCIDMPDYSFLDFIKNLFDELENQEIEKFIIDIRLNSGGNSLIITPLIEELKLHKELTGKIYACIGCKTFSSGVKNAIQLKNELGAILVGEPTGGKPNSYGELKEMLLPNTKLTIKYSTKYFTLLQDNNINTLEPDYFVETNSNESFLGVDPYVEFIKLR